MGTRATSTQAPVEFEIPRPVIAEAIVNAVAHRNYHSNEFVQVLVFAEYQKLTGLSRATATRDLDELFSKGVLKKVGTTGKGTHYVLLKRNITGMGHRGHEFYHDRKGTKWEQWGHIGPNRPSPLKPDINRTNMTIKRKDYTQEQ